MAAFQRLFMQTWQKQDGSPMAPRDYFPMLTPQGSEIVRVIGSTPDDRFSVMYVTLISAIANAQRQVYLTNAYFVPDAQLLTALIDAAARGVDVQLILPAHSDSKLAFYAGRANYDALLAGGVRVYERRGSLLHAKTALIDSVWACVGSSNLDWRSALDNDEINAEILGRGFGKTMQEAFAKDMAASDEMTLTQWRKRAWWLRV